MYWVPGVISPGLKQPRCTADHWPLSSAKVKKEWNYILLLQYVFVSRTGTLHFYCIEK
jgi:hypothetical protein